MIMKRYSEFRPVWKELIKHGITEVQFWGSEIPSFFSDMMKMDPDTWADRVEEYINTKGPGRVVKFMGEMYNFEDQIYRIAAYNKLTDFKDIRDFYARTGQALPKWIPRTRNPRALSPEEAASEINIAFQNYRKLPAVVNFLRKYPVFGPFISFRANMVKILGSQAKRAMEEIAAGSGHGKPLEPLVGGPGRGGRGPVPPEPPGGWPGGVAPKGPQQKDPALYRRGMKRLWRLMLYASLPALICEVSRKVFDINEDDLNELFQYEPAYRKYGTLFFYRRNGKLKFVDLTYILPGYDILRAFRLTGRSLYESFRKVLTKKPVEAEFRDVQDAWNLLEHPLIDMYSIIFKAQNPMTDEHIPGSLAGRIISGVGNLFMPQSLPFPDIEALLKEGKIKGGPMTPYQIKAIMDAFNENPDRWGQVRDKGDELRAFFLGLRAYNVDPRISVEKFQGRMKGKIAEIEKEYSKWLSANAGAKKETILAKRDTYQTRIGEYEDKIRKSTDFIKKLMDKANLELRYKMP
jgi:hypothetical protein